MRALRLLIAAGAGLGVAAFAAAALLTVADVVGRRFGAPIVGVIDLVQLCVLAGAWLVIPYAFLAGAHVGVDLVVEHLPARLNRVFRAVAGLAGAALALLILWGSWGAARQQMMFGDVSQQLGIPIIWYWAPLLLGAALSILAALLTVADALAGHPDRTPELNAE